MRHDSLDKSSTVGRTLAADTSAPVPRRPLKLRKQRSHARGGRTFKAQLTAERELTGKLAEALKFAAEKFRWYEQLHAAKPDMDKATRNAAFATVCEQALSLVPADRRKI